MAVTKSQKINLGIFVFFSLTLLISGIVFLVGLSLWEKKDSYIIRFSSKKVSMSGLDVGSAVKYSGIQIGRVTAIRIDPEDVSVIIVKLEIEADTPIAEDSVATLGNVGITGLKYVELSRGSLSARIREVGEEIPSGPSFMDEISGQASIIAQKTEVLLNRLNNFLADERQKEFWDTITQVKELVQTATRSVEETAPEMKQLGQKMNVLATDLGSTVTTFNRFLNENSPEIQAILISTRNLMQDIHQTRLKLNNLLDQSQSVMASVDHNLGEAGLKNTIVKLNKFLDQGTLMLKQSEEEILLTLEHLRETSENLDDFSILIKENPSLLLRTQDVEEKAIK
ncbi:MlaD family protein [candidate division CSSED10-310 bacterium]|uniref:MlaD family protein n=1 Tax=candidate division CSSED10-310 bacterium TaxID=2855610 RepID=A0ABV6YTW1_UNCC1